MPTPKLCVVQGLAIALCPGLPMFFDSCEKSGRPGQSDDVMDTVWDAVGLLLPTRPRNLLLIEKLCVAIDTLV